MKKFIHLLILLFVTCSSWGQFSGLVVNEFSQGSTGNPSPSTNTKEYIELIVVGTKTCTDSTADLRGWIFDDQNQWYGTASNAPGHYRFKNAAVWQAVPYGSIIVIYNSGDKNLSLPPDIIDPANYTYIVPINGTNLFEQNIISPNALASPTYVYPAASVTTNYTATNNQWPFIFALNNSSAGPPPTPGDVVSLISPADRANAFFSIGYDFPIAAGYRSPSVSIPIVSGGYCAYLTTSNYTSAASWTIATVSAGETPGQPNGGANTAWINGMRSAAAPTITLASGTTDVCFNAGSQTTTLVYSAVTNSPTNYSITWSNSPANNFLSVTDAVLPNSPIVISIPANTTAGIYTGYLTVKNSGGYVSCPVAFTVIVKGGLASFSVNTNPQCFAGNNFTFTNNSTIALCGDRFTSLWNYTTTAAAVVSGPGASYVKALDQNAGGSGVTMSITGSIRQVTANPPNPSPWPATRATAANSYIEYTILPLPGRKLTVDTISWVNRQTGGSGSLNISLEYAINGGSFSSIGINNLGTGTGNLNVLYALTSSIVINVGDSLKLRLYIYGTTNTNTRILLLDDFTVKGTADIFSSAPAYLWDFGDGSPTVTTTNASHSYTSAGTYAVKLTASNNCGCTDDSVVNVVVALPPTPSFTVNNPTQCLAGNSFVFTNTTTGATSYAWSFGDGSTASSPVATHTYTAGGIYTVKLVVSNAGGCKDSTTTMVVVNAPTAGFTVNANPQCLTGNTFTFTNTSAPNACTNVVSASWALNNATTNTVTTTQGQGYSASSMVIGSDIVNGGYSNSNGFRADVSTADWPASATNNYYIDFPFSPQTGYNLDINSFSFTAHTANKTTNSYVKWAYVLNGGAPVFFGGVITVPSGSTVVVPVIAVNGVSALSGQTLVLRLYLYADAGTGGGSSGRHLDIKNMVISGTATIASTTGSYLWNFGDASPTVTTTNATHTYASAGTYPVKLTVTNGCTCVDDTTVNVTINPMPTAPVLTIANNCGSSTITATGVTGTLTWSDGGTGNPRTVTSGTYTVTQTIGTCTSVSSNAVTAAPLAVPSAPVLTITNNCGTSTITATGVTGTLTWSDGGAGNPRTVTSGTYTVTQTLGTCTSVSSNAVTAAPLAVPIAPTLSITNNCGSSTITATGVTGTLTWSDGGAGNPRTVTSGTYTVTQTLGTCTSVSSNAVTAAPLAVPIAPTLSITNNCGSSTITATGVTGTLTWSDGGTGNPRTVTSGTYTVTQTVGTCTSLPSNSVTAAPLAVPIAPTLSITNNCGSSTITATGVTGTLTWSDGGTGNPRTVTSGTYTVTQTVGTCTSLPSNSVTAAPLAVPIAPTLSITNDCGSSTITATGVTGTLTWSDGGTGNPRTVTSGTYTVTQTVGTCTSLPSNSVTAAPLAVPIAPTLSITNNCGSSTITATGVTGTLTWSDGGTGNPRTVTSGTYTVTQTVGTCTSASSNSVTATPLAVPSAPVLTITNNCGSSIITATGVTGTLTWSDGGTGNPRTVTTGTYTVTQTVGTCTSVSSNAVTAAPLAIPSAPVLTITNNCGSSTITATGVTGTLTWSDGGTGNPRTVTSGTYTVTQTVGSCTSVSSNAVTAAPLAVPLAPVLTITNNCGSSTITATGVTGTLTWSDGGTGNPRTVTSGTYTVTQTVGTCTSVSSNAVTAAPLAVPLAPVLTITNNCGSSTITVTGVTGTLLWSDGGTGNPRIVTSGTYTVTQTVGTCTSSLSNAVTAAPLAVPLAPILTITNNCGSSTITATGVTGTLTWSDGGIGNPRIVTSGTYTVTQTAGTCTSASSNSVTAAPLAVPLAPVLTITNNCGTSTITATGVTGTLTWSDGGTGNPRTVTSGTYTVTQTVGSCTSVSSNAVTATPLAVPLAPVLTITNNCGASTITATGITGTLTWSDGGTGNPRTVTTGTYTVTQTIGTCTSVSSNAVTAAPLAVPLAPTAMTPQSFCNSVNPTISDLVASGSNLQWYSALTNGTPLASTTVLVNNTTYYVSQAVAGCESGRTAVTVTITHAVTPSVSITPATVTSCTGSPVTFTASPVNGGTAPTYQWQVNGTNVTATGSTFTSTTLNNNDVVTVVMTSNAACAATPTAISNAVTVIITSAAAPAVSITPTTVISCNGSPVTFTASPVNGGTAPTYQWQVNGTNVIATGSTVTTSILNNNDVVTVVLTSNASCATTATATSNAVTVTITSAAAPSVAITSTTVTSCSGSPITFTATPVNGGTAPTYQWQVNGANITGATGAIFTSSTLNNNDVVTVVLTSNAICATTPTATSNAVTVTITSAAAPSVSITPTTVISCNGSSVTFTASPVNGGTAPSYQWKINGANVTGATGATFTSSTLNNNDVVTVVLTSTASCATTPTATSNAVTVTITSAAAPSVAITPTTVTSCSGSPITFTATPVNGGTAPTYQWQVNGTNITATGSTFTSTLNNNDVVTVVMTSNASCATTPTATSNAVTVTITSAAAPSVSITPPIVTSCSGSPVTFTASPVNGGTAPNYQWQVNGTNVVGATGSTFTTSTLNTNDVVTVVLTSNATCATTPTATSNAVTVTITSAAAPSVTITPTIVTSCNGSPVTFTASPVNGGTAPSYQWKVNGANVVGATGSTFTTSTLNNNEVVTVVITSNATCATTPTATSNAVTVTITSAAASSVSITPTIVTSCSGSPVTFIASPVNGGTAPTYQWQVNGANVIGATGATFTSSTLSNNDVITVVMKSNAACATVSTATSNAVTVTITSAASLSVTITPTIVTSCNGSPVTFTASPVNGGTAPSYQWKINGANVVGATGSTFTISALNNNDVVTVVLTSNASCATTPTATSNAVTVMITSAAAPSVSITPTTVISCNGSSVTFTASPVNGGTSPSYQWKINGANVVGATGSIFTTSTLNNNDVVTVVLTSNATCATTPTATSNAVTIAITSAAAPSVSITPTTVTSCSGSPVTFTALPVNGGTAPTYQWKINGTNVIGATGATFTTSTLNNNDVVTVVMTSNSTCASTPTATSNAVTVTITSAVSSSVSITPISVTSCNGSPVTFTASPVNGGTAPTYQWKINGTNVAGATGSTFTSSTLNNNDVVTVVMTSNATCAATQTATSNAVTVTITSAAAPSVSITPITVTSCNGSPVTFTATPINGGTAPTYQWKVNGTNVVGATGPTFTSSTLNNNDVVTVVLTSNATCATTPTATSNAVTVTITSAAAPSVNITPTTVTSCNGSPITFTASPVNGGTAPSYQWKVNGTNIIGATGSTFTTSTLSNNDVVTVVLTSNASCATTPTATSNAVTVTITLAAAPSVSITPTTVTSCHGSPVTFTASPVNGGTAPTYQWKVNGTNIIGATGATFTSSTLSNNDVVTVVMTSNASCAITPTVTSNAVTVTITSAAIPSVSITPVTVTSCNGSPVTFTASPVNGGTAPTYQWKVNGTNVIGATGSTFTTSTLSNNDVVTVVLISNATCATTPTATSNAVTVIITSAAAPSVSITPTIVTSCNGLPITFTTSPVNGGSAPTYQWKINGTNVAGATGSTFTSSTLNNNDVVTVVMTSNASCATTPTATSNAVTVTITSAVSPSVTITPTTVISCSGSPITFAALPVNGGAAPTYQWKINGVNVAGATGSTFTSSTLNNNDVVTVVITSNASCATTPTATSNPVTVTITSAAAPSVSITPTTVISCNGSSVTFTASPVNGGAAPTYQWKVNGASVAGATGSLFTTSTLNNNDVVTVVITSSSTCAITPTATSNAVTVRVQNITPVRKDTTLNGCTSVVYNSITYTTSTVIRDTVKTAFGCDSIYHLTNINVALSPISRTDSLNGCTSVVFKGITYTSAAVIKDTVKTSFGCDSIFRTTIISIAPFVLNITAAPNPVTYGNAVTLVTTSTSTYNVITWQPVVMFPNQTAMRQTVVADSSFKVNVIARSSSSCLDTASVSVEVLIPNDFFVPNAFTPNNDGNNDFFKPFGTGMRTADIMIFNQFGEMIYHSNSVNGWNGTYKGKQQPVGVYSYVVKASFINGTVIDKKGLFNLIR